MKNHFGFDVQGNIGLFVYLDEQIQPLLNEFYDLMDAHQSGQINDKQYADELNRLIGLEPDFIDLHSHLSFLFLEQNNPKKALSAAMSGIAIGDRLIPDSFSGVIEWGYVDNRPYLRALQGAVLANVRLRRHKDASVLIDKLLTINPNDNQGMRYILGSELLRAGDRERAASIFDKCSNYPPYHYEQALLHILNKDWVKAATVLRRGFAANRYIAEMLCGNLSPQPLAIWHGTNLAEPEIASEYLEMYGNLWFSNPEALKFIRWLFNHSSILSERASLMKCAEDLFSEQDFFGRERIASHQKELIRGIDHRLSKKIVKVVNTIQGQKISPWEH
jgi:tetratricopeptide (TPR) repeat protein